MEKTGEHKTSVSCFDYPKRRRFNRAHILRTMVWIRLLLLEHKCEAEQFEFSYINGGNKKASGKVKNWFLGKSPASPGSVLKLSRLASLKTGFVEIYELPLFKLLVNKHLSEPEIKSIVKPLTYNWNVDREGYFYYRINFRDERDVPQELLYSRNLYEITKLLAYLRLAECKKESEKHFAILEKVYTIFPRVAREELFKESYMMLYRCLRDLHRRMPMSKKFLKPSIENIRYELSEEWEMKLRQIERAKSTGVKCIGVNTGQMSRRASFGSDSKPISEEDTKVLKRAGFKDLDDFVYCLARALREEPMFKEKFPKSQLSKTEIEFLKRAGVSNKSFAPDEIIEKTIEADLLKELQILAEKSFSLNEVSEHIKLQDNEIRLLVKQRKIYFFNFEQENRFPRWQFNVGGGFVDEISDLFQMLPTDAHPISVTQFFTTPKVDLEIGDKLQACQLTPVEWLSQGRSKKPIMLMLKYF